MAKGYTNANAFAQYLGVTLSTAQSNALTPLLDAVESLIDSRTGRSWLGATSIGPEYYWNQEYYREDTNNFNEFLRLKNAPLVSVTSFTYRLFLLGEETALDPNLQQYEIRDASIGLIWLPFWRGYDRLTISYTVTNAIDPLVTHCANIILSHWMRPVLESVMPGVHSYSIGGQLHVTHDQMVEKYGIPGEAEALIRNDLMGSFFFA